MRLFIAVNFPDGVKAALCGAAEALRARSISGSFSRRENLHLTLAFLGEVHPRRVMEIRRVMDALGGGAFDIALSGFGKFRSGAQCLYWRGVEGGPHLSELQKKLVSGLLAAGFAVDDKPFRPHITLARRCIMEEGFHEREFAASLPDLPVHVDAVSLMRSDRAGGKLVYTEMYRAEL